MKRITLVVVLILIVLLAACAPVPATPGNIDVIVQQTFVAMTVQAAVQSTGTAVPQFALTGSISGTLSFPSEGIPPLRVAAFDVQTNEAYWVDTAQNQTTYQIDNLPSGAYHVLAYPIGDTGVPLTLIGAYDQFYLCGMHQGCSDTALVDVLVQAGAVTPDIDPGDWYNGDAVYPPMPGEGVVFSPTQIQTGIISGTLNYPADALPAMAVVAFKVDSPNEYYYALTIEGESSYQITGLTPGSYYVVAYSIEGGGFPGGLAGGYTQAVPCGLLESCTDHSLIPVQVNAGQFVGGIRPADWYAPEGTFPPSPIQ